MLMHVLYSRGHISPAKCTACRKEIPNETAKCFRKGKRRGEAAKGRVSNRYASHVTHSALKFSEEPQIIIKLFAMLVYQNLSSLLSECR